jgi:PKD repeat protein
MARHHLPPAALLIALAASALSAGACDNDTQTNPTPTMTAGSITVSPPNVGLVEITAFAFAAQGFSSSDGGALTYTWDFNDGTKMTGGASVTHVFTSTGTFDIWVTATNAAGVTAQARLNKRQVVNLSSHWTLSDAGGLTIMYGTSLTQGGATLWGDQTFLNCRYTVTGTIAAPGTLTITYAHGPGDIRAPTDCQDLPPYIPWTLTFTGTADAAFNVFTGTMTPGGPATLTRCTGPYGC